MEDLMNLFEFYFLKEVAKVMSAHARLAFHYASCYCIIQHAPCIKL